MQTPVVLFKHEIFDSKKINPGYCLTITNTNKKKTSTISSYVILISIARDYNNNTILFLQKTLSLFAKILRNIFTRFYQVVNGNRALKIEEDIVLAMLSSSLNIQRSSQRER